MAKKLFLASDIDVAQNAVLLDGNIPIERILLITNVTAGTNKIIYNFADSTLGATSCAYIPSTNQTRLVLATNFASAGAGPVTVNSKLQIFIEEEFSRIGFEEAMIDPVNKLRVSNPENLIDTDFEYGTQSTKWETLQTVLNVPTIYSSSGDLTLEGLISINTTTSSKQVRCVFSLPHNQVIGNAIQVTGVSNITCEGAFLVTGVVNSTEFFYEIDAAAVATENVAGSYTSVIPAKFFEGSNLILDLNAVDASDNPVAPIQTNGASPSTLTIRTLEPHGLKVNTKVYLRQTIGPKELTITDPTLTAPDGRPYIDSSPTITIVNNVDGTSSTGSADFQYDRPVVTWDWQSTYGKYLQTSDINAATDEITWNTHGLTANAALLFNDPVRGDDTTATTNGGMTDGTVYYAFIVDANTIKLATDYGTLASFVNLTAISTTRGYPRLQLVYKVEDRKDDTRFTAFFSRNVTTGATGNYDIGYINNTNTNSFTWNVQSIMGASRVPTQGIINQLYFEGANTAGSPINITYLARNYLNLGNDNIGYSLAAKGSGGGSEFPNTDITRCFYLSGGDHFIDIQYQFGAINRDKFGNPTSNYRTIWYIVIDHVPTSLNTAHSGADLAGGQFGKGARSGNRIIGFQGRVPNGSSTNGANDEFTFQSNTKNNGRYGTSNPPFNYQVTGSTTLGSFTVNYPQSGSSAYGTTSEIFYSFVDDLTALKNTFYIPNHGITNNETCTISITGSGYSTTNRFAFVNSSATVVPYTVSEFSVTANVVNANYLRFTSRTSPFTNDVASFPAAFSVSNNKINTLYNTVYIQNHKISGQTTATYSTPGTVIGGLTSGTNYSLQFVNDSRLIIKTANTSGAGSATTSAFGSTSTSLNQVFTVNIETPLGTVPTQCTVTQIQHRGRLSTSARFLRTRFADNIVYNIGAVNGQDSSIFQNEPTWVPKDVSSFLTGSPVGVSVTVSPTSGVNAAVPGMSNWWELRLVVTATVGTILLSSSGSGVQTFQVLSQDGAYDGIYGISTVPNSQTFTVNVPFKIPARTYSFNSRSDANGGAVNSTNDTIVLGTLSTPYNPTNFYPGELVSYVPGAGNTDMIGAAGVDNNYLYAIPVSEIAISLANSYVSAIGGQVLQLTPTGTSQTQSIQTTNVLKTTKQSGSVSGSQNARIITGSGTRFLSKFKRFDSIYIYIGARLFEYSIDRVISDTEMTIDPAFPGFPSTFSTANYSTISSVNLRPDGFSLHKSFDGGIDITAGTSPNSKIVRQSRKYFRYQSGKGIQNSFAINFSPLKTLQKLEYVNIGGATPNAIRATCQEPHNLSVGNTVIIEKALVTTGNNIYNGTFPVHSIQDINTFTYLVGAIPQQQNAAGYPEYGRDSWSQSSIRAGMFDDANGFFFEYDGQKLYAVRRSSTLQLSGSVSATKNSQVINGLNTSFQTQLVVGDHVQIRGQVYRVIAIDSDSRMVVQPPYRGISAAGIKATIREDVRVEQANWNIDPCDGNGVNGYILDIHKIQMCYADYSWYGAGKIRFGTKDAKGHIHYHHEFIHNNKLNESYLRSGNLPARYEIENGDAPTSAPTLFHFGTSVIMDGTFDDDDAYLFTAQSKPFVFALGLTQTVTSTAASQFSEITLNSRRVFVYSFQCSGADADKAIVGQLIKDATGNIPDGTYVSQVQKAGASSRIFTSFPATTSVPNNPEIPTSTAFTIGENAFGNGAVDLTRPIPLISIRLAPAVDSGITGAVGEREIINRMQMKLDSGAITTNKSVNVFFILNGNPSKLTFEKVQSPSLSNAISHDTGDIIRDGTVIFSSQASAGSTNFVLSGLIDMGNSILGGDSVYPNGPDLLTIAIQPTDTSTITQASPLQVNGKLSWSESQA
jgi:hypothetical protein